MTTNKMVPQILYNALSRPNAVETFTQRVSLLRKTLRTVDEGVPRTEENMIRAFSSWRHDISNEEMNKVRPGDSSVLVPLIESSKDKQPWIIFTHRSYLLRRHRGEISFPGGRIDENETIEQAAIREAEEEIGLKEDDITLWGRLPQMRTRFNNNKITPVLGVINEKALDRLVIQTSEVQSIFMSPLIELAEMNYTAFRLGSTIYHMPVYHTTKYKMLKKSENAYEPPDQIRIWGLTAGILNEVLAAFLPDEHYKYVP